MTEQTTTRYSKENREAPLPGMIDTIIHLGTATTNLAIDQVGNAFTALVHPNEAIEHVKETLLNLSNAMNHSAASSRTAAKQAQEATASDLRGASSGMEYVTTERVQAPFVDVRRPGEIPERVRPVKINHRKG